MMYNVAIVSQTHHGKEFPQMKQISFYLKTIDDFDACINAFHASCPREYSAILATVFSGWDDDEAAMDVIRRIEREVPDAVIAGSTTAGEIISGAMSERTVIMSFMIFDETRLSLSVIDFSAVGPEEAALSLIKECSEHFSVAGIELLIAKSDDALYSFLRHTRPLPAGIPVFGGVAGTYGRGNQRVYTTSGVIRSGVVAVVFVSQTLEVRVNNSMGWRPMGPSFLITAIGGTDTILELDGRPAGLVYKKYLTISPENFRDENLLFPLALERNGERVLRLPTGCTKGGALTMSGDCESGERVRLAYGDPSELLDASYNLRMDIMTFEPEAILLFNCISHHLFLLADTNQELQPFQTIAPNAGFYTYGEIGRRDGEDLMILNMALVSVSFREGSRDRSHPPEMPPSPPQKELTNSMKLVQYLAHFVTVTAAELESANKQLTELASLDRLTGIYNRGEIESILRKELMGNRGDERTLSAIMIDLDNFKSINDTYGHSTGDRALQWAATVMKRNIRRGDAAGRWGGEEFIILLPGAPLSAATAIAERIRRSLTEGYSLPNGEPLTASFGVAEFPRSGSYIDFYRRLDDALYEAKAFGKNCVRAAGTSDSSPVAGESGQLMSS